MVCRETRPKRELTRLVRVPDEPLRLDPTGKLAGRGAYLCEEPDCWHRAAQGKALDKALKVELGGADRAVLRARADELETREMDA